MARKQESAKEPLWEIPWFEYRRNAVVGGIRLTNNVGFIDDDVELPKPKGVFRIACVGGSTTMEGGGKDLTYPNILERELRKFFNRNDIEVINCGVGGIDSLGERRRTLDYIRLQPDLIIHYNAVNDICHGLFPLWEKDAPAWQRILRHSAFVNLYLNWLLLPPSTTISEHFDRATFHNLRDMQQCIQAKHIDTAICSFAHPDYASLSRKERRFFESILRKHWQGKYVSFQNYCRLVEVYNAKVRALCQEKGIMYLPVAESIHGGTNFFGDICHMQQAGIERKAEVIFEALKDYVGARLGSKPAQP